MSSALSEIEAMKSKRIPQLPFQIWSDQWKEARKQTTTVERVLTLLTQMPTQQWERPQLVDILGFRKNTKEDKGEQRIERQLLGPKGCPRTHIIQIRGKCCQLDALRHNAALSRHKSGQVIVDVLGKVLISGKWHPLAIEIKKTQGNCWSAVVQNIQQVRMLRHQSKASKKHFDAKGGVWGMVLAPKKYFEKNPAAVQKSIELLHRLKKTELRIALCYSDALADGKIECFHSNWSV